MAVPQQGIKDITVPKNGRCIVFVDTLALFAHYQCSLHSNEERSVLLVHADRISPEHFQAVIDKYNNKEQRGVPILPIVHHFLGRRDLPLPREIQTMTYLPPQAKLLLKNIQTANQMMLANSARMEEDFQQRSDPIVVETVFQTDALEVLVNSEMAREIVERALDSDDGPVSSAYRLEGGRRICSGIEVLDDEGLTSFIVGPSIQAPPINLDPEERKSEIRFLKKTLTLSLQSPDAPEPETFIIRQRQCVHCRAWEDCRTCSLRENSAKPAAELLVSDLEWHECWKEDATLWADVSSVCQAVVDTANLSQALHTMVDVDVHELLTSLQYLAVARATQHNFMS